MDPDTDLPAILGVFVDGLTAAMLGAAGPLTGVGRHLRNPRLHPELAVDTLVNLRITAEHAHCGRRATQPGRLPAQIRRWVNIYDPADPVAGAGAIGRLWAEVED